MGYRVRPPELPGDAEGRERLRHQEQRRRTAWAEQRRMDSIRGERQRLAAIRLLEAEAVVLARLGVTTNEAQRAWLETQAADLRRYANEEMKEAESGMSRDRARDLRKAFREKFQKVAACYQEAQSDKYPEDFRRRETETALREMRMLEAQFQNDVIVWPHGQQVEAARLRHAEPTLDAAGEMRRLRETMEVEALTKRFPSKVQMQNFALPIARQALAAGNVGKARVHNEAAQRLGAFDGSIERGINSALDRDEPNRRKAIEIEVEAADELELSRRAIAEARVLHKINSPQEQAAASTAVKMADFKRQQEAVVLREESGIELSSTD